MNYAFISVVNSTMNGYFTSQVFTKYKKIAYLHIPQSTDATDRCSHSCLLRTSSVVTICCATGLSSASSRQQILISAM